MNPLKATAIAHPMQGLVKYHGMRNSELRIPFHDSISVNIESLWTKTTVEFGDFSEDQLFIGRKRVEGASVQRVLSVVDHVRKICDVESKARIESQNSLSYDEAKGLGFSASAGAALTVAACKAAGFEEKYGWDMKVLSRIARRFAGSASRSVVGGFARWVAGEDDESSYAYNIGGRDLLDLGILIVPVPSHIRTEDAHLEVLTSPFFDARIASAQLRADRMEKAIREGDLNEVGWLAEQDSLELHALTMTGEKSMLIFAPESIRVIQMVRRLREGGMPVYFSMQTGPSVFINTRPELVNDVKNEIVDLGFKPFTSRVGGEARIVES